MPLNTKVMLAEALLELSKEKSLDKITIKDMVDRCSISRQAFYYHFKDIFEVLEWSMEQEMKKALAQSLKADDPLSALRVFVEMTVKNRAILMRMLDSQQRHQVEALFVTGIKSYLGELFRQWAKGLSVTYADMETALNFYSYGIAGLLLSQSGGDTKDPERTAEQIYGLLRGTFLQPGQKGGE